MTTKVIHLSNLAARYYTKYGWNATILLKYLIKGEGCKAGFLRQNFMNKNDEYYILEPHCSMNVDRLLEDYPDIEVIPHRDNEINKSKKELLESRNW